MLGATHAVGFDTYSMRSSLRKLVLHVSSRRWEQYLGLFRRAALKEIWGFHLSPASGDKVEEGECHPGKKARKHAVALIRKRRT